MLQVNFGLFFLESRHVFSISPGVCMMVLDTLFLNVDIDLQKLQQSHFAYTV
jgi:hypothetical protein